MERKEKSGFVLRVANHDPTSCKTKETISRENYLVQKFSQILRTRWRGM